MDMDIDIEKQRKIAAFLEIAVQSTEERARQFLQATNWHLEEAIHLFYTAEEEANDVRPPLPVRRETLYHGHDHHYGDGDHSLREAQFRNVWENGLSSSWDGDRNGGVDLAALFAPPFELMFRGSFEQAKLEGAARGKWLIANVQSPQEFASHKLNRDTWSHEAIKAMVSTNFIFWQIPDVTEEGRKVCTYYRLENLPSTLVIDPITGQQMKAWSGTIDPEGLLETLIAFANEGPPKSHENKKTMPVTDENPEEGENEYPETDGNPTPLKEEGEYEYPPLPEEPEAKADNVCTVGVRFPDGKRIRRRFLLRDPIRLLWSLSYFHLQGHVDDADVHGRSFKLVHALGPGSAKVLDYDTNLTFAESRLPNSLVSLIWE